MGECLQKDLATVYVGDRAGDFSELGPAEAQRLIRKLDFVLVPMLLVTATLGAVDKVALSTAAIYGLPEGTKLAPNQFLWVGSMLYVGLLIGMLPMCYALLRFRLGKVLSGASIAWSACALLMCACKGFGGLMAVRFFMGLFECAIVPGCTLMVLRFYTRKQQGVRLAVVFAFLSSVVNAFLLWLVGCFPGLFPKWKGLYLLVGSLSLVWGMVMVAFLPDLPLNTWWLTPKERYYLSTSMLRNRTGVESRDWQWNQARAALLDPKTYVVLLFNIAINIPNGGLSTFAAIIVHNLGFNSRQSSLMGAPSGVIATLASVGFNWWSSRTSTRRCLIVVVALFVPLVGSILLYTVNRALVAPQLVGLYLLYFYFAPYVMLMALVQANTAGNTQKAVVYSVNYLGYCAGAIIGPQTFRDSQAPRYTGGFAAMSSAYVACMALMAVYWWLCSKENRRIKEDGPTLGDVSFEGFGEAVLKLTT